MILFDLMYPGLHAVNPILMYPGLHAVNPIDLGSQMCVYMCNITMKR